MDDVLQGLFPLRVNVEEGVFRSNILSAIKRDLPWLQQQDANHGKVCIVAGGPSLVDGLQKLKWMAANGYKIIAVNNTAKWLIDRDIRPDYHVLLDARPSCARFIQPGIMCLIASQCSPEVFDATELKILWHPNIEGIQEFIVDRECALIGGGTTVGLQAMSIAYTMGYRDMTLFGFDGSYRGQEGHAYPQAENDGEPLVKVQFAGRDFMCARWMVRQVEEFRGVLKQLVELDCSIKVEGDGYLQSTVAEMLKTTLTAVYDLAVSPPTYDFLSFLVEAEKERVKKRHTYINIIFVPGPKGGFRDDNLPPSVEERQGMLHRICVSACRLLPSVRNVSILGERTEIQGDIFPQGWTVLTPISCYGSAYVKDAIRPLRATSLAKSIVKRPRPYVTITMREAGYWPERNSNHQAWENASSFFVSQGYEVVVINDTMQAIDAVAWDIDLRLATYEGAVCNLGVNGGPIGLLYFSNSPYLIFKIVTKSVYSSSIEFLRKNGIEEGDQFGANGRIVWKDDDVETIISEFTEFMNIKEAA